MEVRTKHLGTELAAQRFDRVRIEVPVEPQQPTARSEFHTNHDAAAGVREVTGELDGPFERPREVDPVAECTATPEARVHGHETKAVEPDSDRRERRRAVQEVG